MIRKASVGVSSANRKYPANVRRASGVRAKRNAFVVIMTLSIVLRILSATFQDR